MQALLLAGGGHAHVEVLRRLPPHGAVARAAVLVNPSRWFVYSGMVPGVVAGHYPFEACRIDLAACCARAGVRFIEAQVDRLDLRQNVAYLDTGQVVPFQLVSLDVGSSPDPEAIEGAQQHAVAVRPLAALVHEWQAWLDGWAQGRTRAGLVVVGGGAGGAEMAMAAAHAMRRVAPSTGRRAVTVVSDRLVPSHGEDVGRRVARALRRLDVDLVTRRVARIATDAVTCVGGETIPAGMVVYATGAVAAPWLRASGLETDDSGCVLVEPTLRSVSHPDVFAVGDAATMASHPLPKAGVFAVRHGAVLAGNLAGALSGAPLDPYRPQRRWLSLISLGQRRAIGSYGALTWEGRWVWRWKDVIDRRFVRGA